MGSGHINQYGIINNMKQAQLKIAVHVHSIKLQVRFPCAITASLRVEHEEVPFGQEVPLRLGQALCDMSASHQFTVSFDSSRKEFDQKKIAVLLFLKSSSGRIPAGSVNLSLNAIGQVNNQQKYSVEKCPDKYAVVEMSVSCECLNEIDCVPMNPPTDRSQKSDREMRISFGNERKRTLKKSMIKDERQQGRSNAGEGLAYELNSSYSKDQLNGSGADLSPYQSPGRSNQPDYGMKSRIQHLERELKNLHGKYDQQNLELKGSATKKDILERSLKDTEGQLRSIREKYADLQTEHENTLRKCQFREGSLRQQMRHTSEKLSHSEAEVQKMIFEKNDLINDFEVRERQLRSDLRDREKNTSQDKIKLSKKLEQMTNLYNELKGKHADGDMRSSELEKELSKEKRRCEEEELAKSNLAYEVSLLKEQLNLQKQQVKQLQEALASNEQLEEERKKFRKKIGDLQQDINIQIKNTINAEATAQRHLKRCEELDDTMKDKLSTIKQLSKDIEGLNKDIDELKHAVSDRDKKSDHYSSQKQKQIAKLEVQVRELGDSLKKTQEDLGDNKKKVKQRDNIIAELKKQMQAQYDDIGNMNKKNGELEIELAERSSQISRLTFGLEQMSLQKDSAMIEKAELEVQLDSYICDLEELKKEYQSYSTKNEEVRRNMEKQIQTLKYRISNSSEQSSFQITELQRKVALLEEQVKAKSVQIRQQQAYTETLEDDKAKMIHLNNELIHTVELRDKQVAFMSESLDKANLDISEGITKMKNQSNQIERLKQSVEELNQELQFTSQELNKANSSGSSTKQQMDDYKSKNLQHIKVFAEAIGKGKISIEPAHQDSKIVELMVAAIERNNLDIKDREGQYKKIQESNKSFLDDLSEFQLANEQLNKDLELVTGQLSAEIKKNGALNENMRILEETYEKSKKDLLNNSSSQVSKLNQTIEKLDTQLSELKRRFEDQTQTLADTKQELSQVKKQLKQVSNSSAGESKSLRAQVQKLEKEAERKSKEIESKAATIFKYGQIEKQLREKLNDSNNQIASLKELNENIRKRNELVSVKEVQLQKELAKLKQLKEAQAKKDQNAQKKLKQDIQGLKAALKIKEEQVRNLQYNIKNAKTDSSASEKAFKEKEAAFNLKIKELQVSLDHERRSGSKEVERLTKLSEGAEKMKIQLEDKIADFVRRLEEKEKGQTLEEEHLKPIREQLTFLRGYMNEYSRVGDQFQASKNKLLKLSNTKLEQYSDRNVAQKLREVSFVFQKLKSFLLVSADLSAKQKEGLAEQLKKMQLSIDRSLRGDR